MVDGYDRPLVTEKRIPTKAALQVQVTVQAPTSDSKKLKEWPIEKVVVLKPEE
jgi:hypothetical protein